MLSPRKRPCGKKKLAKLGYEVKGPTTLTYKLLTQNPFLSSKSMHIHAPLLSSTGRRADGGRAVPLGGARAGHGAGTRSPAPLARVRVEDVSRIGRNRADAAAEFWKKNENRV